MARTLSILLLCGAGTAANAQTPTLFDKLNGPFPIKVEPRNNVTVPDDGTMHVDGTWLSPYCQGGIPVGDIAQANIVWPALHAALNQTVHSGLCDAAEMASDQGWSFDGGQTFPYGETGSGYGYYQIRMQTSYGDADGVHGTVQSFFIRGAQGNTPNLQDPEIDFEFLTDEAWDTKSSSTGAVHLSATGLSGDAISKSFTLPFNPSAAFHRYGFAWSAGSVTFYIDGRAFQTYQLADLTMPTYGMIIMANTWTGIASFGGIPPLESQVSRYRNVRFYANANKPPPPNN